MTNKLPQGWVECKMKDVLEFSQGIQVDVNLQQYSKFSDEYIRFLRIVDFTQKTEPPRYVLNPPTHVIVTDDDISMVRYGAAGFVCTGLNGAIANNLFRIIPKENIFNNRFLYYFLIGDSFQNYIKHKQTGTTMQAISFKIMNEADIVVPPLNEQKRIVEKIEEEFGKIDEGLEKLKLAQEQIKQYRQSVLKSAFDGKLYKTTEWRNVAIKDVADVGTGATPLKSNSKYYGGNIAWVTSGELNNNFVTTASDYITDLAVKETNVTVYPIHTLLIAMYGEGKTRGKCSELLIEAGTNQAIAAIQITNEKVNRGYLNKYCLYNYNNIRFQSMGGVQPNLNLTKIKNILFPLPTLDEQKQIVKEIEKRFEVADEAERVIAENLEKAEQLKQSILKKAFEGRLVPQDPTDQPATELLARIKAERGKNV